MDAERFCEKTITDYRNGDITRRQMLGQIGKAALAAGVVGAFMPTLTKHALGQSNVKIRYDGQGGRWQEAFVKLVLEPFSKETGVPISHGGLSGPDELLAKIQLSNPGDHNTAQLPMEEDAMRFERMGLLEQIDESKIPNLEKLTVPKAVEAFRRLGSTGQVISIPISEAGVWVVYNTEKISEAEVEEKGFKILLDPQYDKVRTGEDNYVKRIVYAALQTDQDPNNITDFDKLWATVRESKARIVKHFKTNAEHTQLFASGEVWLADGRFNATNNLRNQGYPVAGWPKMGTYKMLASFACLKGTHMDSFYHIANMLLDPVVAIPLAIEGGSVPLFDPQKVEFPAEIKALPGFDESGTGEGVRLLDPIYWAEHRDTFLKTYTREMARG